MTAPFQILGPDGRPFARDAEPAKKKLFGSSSSSSYDASLAGAQSAASRRATDPLSHHPWVAATAIKLATVASQAPLRIMQERTAARGNRMVRCGSRRMAVPRHLSNGLAQRLVGLKRNTEPLLDSPLAQLLWRPNPMQDGTALQTVTILNLIMDGQVYWAYTDSEGQFVEAGQAAERIYPLRDRRVLPILENGQAGEVVGYEVSLPRWWPGARYDGEKRVANVVDLTRFALPNPADLLQGLSRYGAAASAILHDLALEANDLAILNKGGVPRFILEFADWINKEESESFEATFREKHSGETGEKTMGRMPAGVTLKQIQQSGVDLGAQAQRNETSAVLQALSGTPGGVLGKTETLHYGNMLAQLFSFWSETIIPIHAVIESALDSTFLFREGDNVFAAYDYSQVEALRAGLAEKAALAEKLAGVTLRMPPRTALELAGVEAERYPGDDVVLVSPMLTPLETVLSGEANEDPLLSPPGASPAPASSGDPLADLAGAVEGLQPKSKIIHMRAIKRVKWRDLIKVQIGGQIKSRKAYLGWTRDVRDETLKAYDKATRGKGSRAYTRDDDFLDITNVIPELSELRSGLRIRSRPAIEAFWRKVYGFTTEVDLGGVAILEIDSPLLAAAIDRRQGILIDSVPKTLQDRIRQTLRTGIEKGETIQEIRNRLQSTFVNAMSPAKSLTVARTHTMGAMNDIRDQMFAAEDAGPESWIRSQDEHTRPDHVVFGDAGPKDRGFNFLDLVGQTDGVLEYPHDTRAPVRQVANCRCAKGLA